MNLLLDVGNSRMKWALSDGKTLSDLGHADHRGDAAGAFYSLDWPKAAAVHIASVMTADDNTKLAERVQARFNFAPVFAQTEPSKHGLTVAYREPRRLGVDRWLAMLALWTETQAPFCVVSAGTALTFDAVDAKGQHLGGVIAPGLLTMQKATLGHTRFETRDLAIPYTAGLGTDTESCVRQGALHAAAGLIERLAGKTTGRRFIGGGDATTLRDQLSGEWDLRPHLVLDGLTRL